MKIHDLATNKFISIIIREKDKFKDGMRTFFENSKQEGRETKEAFQHMQKYDPQLLDDCSKERNDLTYIYDKLSEQNKLSKWFYGHFHKHYRTEKDYTTFIGLGELELKTGI